MNRLFLDANVLFSAVYSRESGLRKLWTIDRATLLTSSYAIEEARRNLDSSKQREDLQELSEDLTVLSTLPDVPLPEDVKLPSKDEPIFKAAMHMEATHLITGDQQDFGPYFNRTIGGVLILPPAEYVSRTET